MNKTLLAVGLMMGLAACGGPQRRVENGKIGEVIDQQMAGRKYIETIGIGAADPSLPTETQRKALARDAAIVKAQYEMLSFLKGVTLEGGVSVSRAIETDSELSAKVKDTIRGASIVKTEFTADQGCVVTLRLPRARVEQLLGVRL